MPTTRWWPVSSTAETSNSLPLSSVFSSELAGVRFDRALIVSHMLILTLCCCSLFHTDSHVGSLVVASSVFFGFLVIVREELSPLPDHLYDMWIFAFQLLIGLVRVFPS
jgi:hypothetical protein